MADLRLLARITVGLGFISCLALVGCIGIPRLLRMHEIHGRVVDAGTGVAVAGAEVFVTYHIESGTEWGGGPAVSRWTTTNAEGRFDFDEESDWVSVPWPGSWLASESPGFSIYHRDYGMAQYDCEGGPLSGPRTPNWQDLTIYVRESPWKKSDTDPSSSRGICWGLTTAGCNRLHRVRRLQR